MHDKSQARVWDSELQCSDFLIKLFRGTSSIVSRHTRLRSTDLDQGWETSGPGEHLMWSALEFSLPKLRKFSLPKLRKRSSMISRYLDSNSKEVTLHNKEKVEFIRLRIFILWKFMSELLWNVFKFFLGGKCPGCARWNPVMRHHSLRKLKKEPVQRLASVLSNQQQATLWIPRELQGKAWSIRRVQVQLQGAAGIKKYYPPAYRLSLPWLIALHSWEVQPAFERDYLNHSWNPIMRHHSGPEWTWV